MPTASRGDELMAVGAVGLGNHDGITAGFAGTDIDDPRSVRRPSQRAGGFNELARSSSEWCRDKPRVKRRRAAASLPRLNCDAASVGGDLEATDCRANLYLKAQRCREVRWLSSRNEFHPYVCESARV